MPLLIRVLIFLIAMCQSLRPKKKNLICNGWELRIGWWGFYSTPGRVASTLDGDREEENGDREDDDYRNQAPKGRRKPQRRGNKRTIYPTPDNYPSEAPQDEVQQEDRHNWSSALRPVGTQPFIGRRPSGPTFARLGSVLVYFLKFFLAI